MAVIKNRNTSQEPIASGLTGKQVIKFIQAPRVYIKAPEETAVPVVIKSNGSTPSGYTDLGIVSGAVRVVYEKELAEVRTGLDQVVRASYIRQRTGSFEAVLSQFDDVVIEQLSGITPSMITAGSIYQFPMGKEDVVSKALLLVVQNKLDGKEWQFYHPKADLSFTIEDSGDEQVVRFTGSLPFFQFASDDVIFVQSIFA